MKKSILILILAGLLTACASVTLDPDHGEKNCESSLNSAPFSENYTESTTRNRPAEVTRPTTQITTKITVTTAVTTTQITTITTASVETTVSADKKKSATTAKKNTEEKNVPEVYEEIDEYKPAEAQYQNKKSHEAEPQMQEITPPATEPPAEPPESSGISQSEINSYIIQSAANYGMAGASVTSGDIWGGGYSFNSPINTAVNDSVYAIESYIDSELSRIYSECLNSGMTSEEIAQYLYVYVCWDG